jgi:cytochrome c biogenesis protein CcmG/thiol:disulfide interchange protein DsbE
VRPRRWAPPLIVIVAVTAVAAGIFTRVGTTSSNSPAPLVGHLAPDFVLPDINGVEHRLSDYRGRVVLVNFWATWCPPCLQEMPLISRAYRSHARRFVVMAVAVRDNIGDVRNFVRQYQLTFVPVLDSNQTVYNDFRLTLQPVSFWIDATGIIRDIHRGAMSPQIIATELERLRVA